MSGDSEIFYDRKTHKQLYLSADLTSINGVSYYQIESQIASHNLKPLNADSAKSKISEKLDGFVNYTVWLPTELHHLQKGV